MTECAGLEIRYTLSAYRGFESLIFRLIWRNITAAGMSLCSGSFVCRRHWCSFVVLYFARHLRLMIILYKSLSEINVFGKENHFVGNTRVLSLWSNRLIYRVLELLALFWTLFCCKTDGDLRQISMWSDSNHPLIWVKTACNLVHITSWFAWFSLQSRPKKGFRLCYLWQ